MTRAEALDKLYTIWSYSKDHQNIDATKVAFLLKDIFDDFESRVCENCKYADWKFDWCDHDLNKWREGAYYKPFKISKEFGCNRFERKIK